MFNEINGNIRHASALEDNHDLHWLVGFSSFECLIKKEW
jgi:hypothetical protein